MRHGSLFSGIGGFDLAAQWMGWENVFHCEWNPFGKKILKYYWPNSISYDDITKTDFTIHRGGIDILTGGFPCQPYSSAGKRLGKNDERHLWPEMYRAIQEIEPTYIVGENVRGIVNWNGGMVFEEVCADLENIGYEVQPILLPAASINAPHRRDRVWFIAYRDGVRFDKCIGEYEIITDTTGIGLESKMANKKLERKIRFKFNPKWNEWDKIGVESALCSGDDGIPTELDGITFRKWRNESIKGYGNAIVPQIVFKIFRTIQRMENL